MPLNHTSTLSPGAAPGDAAAVLGVVDVGLAAVALAGRPTR